MEDRTDVKKRSVAELAGKFSCPIALTDGDANKPVRRRPPRTLQLTANDASASQAQDEKAAGAAPSRKRNSALIEKLQASLTLSPTGPPAFPKSPGVVKLPVPAFPSGCPASPASPPGNLSPEQEETPATFENPAEGGVLKSINKGRARLSIKRRPPSRKHRKSSAEEGGEEVMGTQHNTPNDHEGDVFEQQKTSNCVDTPSNQQSEPETTSTDAEKLLPHEAEPEKQVETTPDKDKDGSEQEEKTEKEVEEEKSEVEQQLVGSTSESEVQDEAHEELVTLAHDKPQTEPDTATDEKETEQKEEEMNH